MFESYCLSRPSAYFIIRSSGAPPEPEPPELPDELGFEPDELPDELLDEPEPPLPELVGGVGPREEPELDDELIEMVGGGPLKPPGGPPP